MEQVAAQAKPIRVVVCNRHPLVCEGIAAVLDREPDITVAGAATSPDVAATVAGRHRPSVVVIGHEPPALDGIALAGALNRLSPCQPAPLLLLEAGSGCDVLAPALACGVRGLLCVEQVHTLLASTIRIVSAGAVMVAATATSRLTALLAQPEPDLTPRAGDHLSGRELEVLRLVAAGLNNQEIAVSLSLSVATVKSHLYSVCRKFQLRDRTQAAVLAYQTGIVRPGSARSSSMAG